MTIAEAKERITSEFIRRYDEWLTDLTNLSDREYGRKYGWLKNDDIPKGNQESYIYFHKYIFCGYAEWASWINNGYDRDILIALLDEKFLAIKTIKWTSYCYISQATAKQIYRDRRTQA